MSDIGIGPLIVKIFNDEIVCAARGLDIRHPPDDGVKLVSVGPFHIASLTIGLSSPGDAKTSSRRHTLGPPVTF